VAGVRRFIALASVAVSAAVCVPGVASAQESLTVSITSRQTNYLWTGKAAKVVVRATLPDGQAAAGRIITVESRPYPYTGGFVADGQSVADGDGRFSYERRPTKNVQVRFRGPAGPPSEMVTLRVFGSPQQGKLKALSGGRQRAVENSLVPPGFRIAKTYLYFCKPKAKVCTFAKTGSAKIRDELMTAIATFKPPAKYAAKDYTVFFRYVPKAGWGDSNALERLRPKRTLPAGDS
jgi:hypothetical protein